MSATATLAVVLLAFFLVGIGAGVAVVTALSARRPRKPPGPAWPVRHDGPGDDEPGDDGPGWPAREDGPRWPTREDDDEGGYWSRGGE